MSSSLRVTAAHILQQLLAGRGSLSAQLQEHRSREDYKLLQEICYGSCRWYPQLNFLLERLLNKPLKKKDRDLHALLTASLYQLRSLSIPSYAVINESVTSAQQMGKPWAKALLNAVLRNYERNRDELEKAILIAGQDIETAHPSWFIDKLAIDWPAQSERILTNNNLRAPMTLRVNQARTTREQAIVQLREANIPATVGGLAPSAIYLTEPTAVDRLPGFRQGTLSIQDEASQLVPSLLQLAPHQRVLDACGAPGGKTGHIYECEDSLTTLVALDKDSRRIVRLNENIQRLSVEASVICADAANPADWWDRVPFDRILLDAPCSGTGVIRRHPDIKLLRSPANIQELHLQQVQMLGALWNCLKSGGLLVYCTCSILKDENEASVAAFLATHDSAKHEPIAADWGVECRYGRQLLTADQHGPDGFYYAVLRKL